jgi:hypothetical protein
MRIYICALYVWLSIAFCTLPRRCIFGFNISDSLWDQRQSLLSEVFNELFSNNSLPSGGASTKSYLSQSLSHIASSCCTDMAIGKNSQDEERRIGCCHKSESQLFNVMIRNGKFTVFTNASTKMNLQQLPPVRSNKNRHVHEFKMDVQTSSEPFRRQSCSQFFRGTLHVIGRGTTHNAYHACKSQGSYTSWHS